MTASTARPANAPASGSAPRSGGPSRSAASKPARAPAPNPRRSRAKRGEGDRLREEILDAATALLAETGDPDAVSTRAVARRVGCSSPSLYLHFPDKGALLYAVCQRQFEHLGARLAEAAAGIDDPVERLRAMGRAYCRFALDHPAMYRSMMMDDLGGISYTQSMEGLRHETGFDVVHDAVEVGIGAGVIADRDPTVIALGLWGTCHGLVSLLLAKPGLEWPPVDTLIDGILDQARDGFLVRPDPPASRRRRRAGGSAGAAAAGR